VTQKEFPLNPVYRTQACNSIMGCNELKTNQPKP